ncbi:MAG TPA: hypothetical protein VJ323_04265 [Bryobacteraceae bacterium]|jgi:hypothetical protein|nr:hypothetical protein [Bryobacteraceae bacterium]
MFDHFTEEEREEMGRRLIDMNRASGVSIETIAQNLRLFNDLPGVEDINWEFVKQLGSPGDTLSTS